MSSDEFSSQSSNSTPRLNEWQRQAIRAQLGRLLESSSFSGSMRLSDFLRFVVETTLAEKAHDLKETVIGTEVFGKDPGYSPREDPVVRVMAGRLRSKLSEYYVNHGADEPVRIELPKGSYVPHITFVQPRSEQVTAETMRIGRTAVGAWRWAYLIAVASAMVPIALIVQSKVGPLRPIPSIAVLPIESLSKDSDQEYFSQGLTDAFITELARLPGIRVLSRTSVLRFKNSKLGIKDIGRQLDVKYVLEGTLFRQQERVRLTTQLIEAEHERHIWAETYDREVRDLLTVEAEVSAAVAHQVQLRLSPKEQERLRARPTLDPIAQDSFLRARYLFIQRNPESLERAIQYYKITISRQPTYAPAYAGLADAYAVTAGNGWLPSAEVLPQAREAANKALQLDPDLGEVHTTLGSIADFFDWNWRNARHEFETAIRLRPNDSTAHQWYGEMLTLSGDFDRGLAESKCALQLDPFSPIANSSYATALYRARKYDAALDQFRKTLELFPGHVPAYVHLGMTYMAMNRLADAIRTLEKASGLTHGASPIVSLLGCAYARSGDRVKAQAILARVQPLRESSPVLPATIYMGLGDLARAIDLLEKGFLLRSAFMNEVRVDPLFDSLRTEPRFKNLISKFRALE